MTDFQLEYQGRSNEELLQLWRERSQLLEEAQATLQDEISKRKLEKPVEETRPAKEGAVKPELTLSSFGLLPWVPLCVLTVVIVYVLLPAHFQERWGDVTYVSAACVEFALIFNPKNFFRKRRSALLNWIGLFVCTIVCALAVQWGNAGGRKVMWRGRPEPAGLFFGMLAFLAVYLTLFFVFRWFRSEVRVENSTPSPT